MLDTIVKGTGNSRTLRTVPNAMTLYSSWTEALQAMIDGTFPIDIGPLNLAGLLQKGTDLNKANLLTDETAALYGKDGNATPDEILAEISGLVASATQTPVQNGTFSGASWSIINFSIKWKLVISYFVESGTGSGVKKWNLFMVKRDGNGFLFRSNGNNAPLASLWTESETAPTDTSVKVWSEIGTTNHYLAIG